MTVAAWSEPRARARDVLPGGQRLPAEGTRLAAVPEVGGFGGEQPDGFRLEQAPPVRQGALAQHELGEARHVHRRGEQARVRSEERRVGKECRSRWWPDL